MLNLRMGRNRPSTITLDDFCFILAETIFERPQREIATDLGLTMEYVSKIARRYGVYRYDKRTIAERKANAQAQG